MTILLEDKVAGGNFMASCNLIFKEPRVAAFLIEKHCEVGSKIFLLGTMIAVVHKLFHLHLLHCIHGINNGKDLDSNEISGRIVKPRRT
jgi:hypothetical protein